MTEQWDYLIAEYIRELFRKGRHFIVRTYDYGHNDMQTDNFCKFCNANQAKYLSSYFHAQRNELLIHGEWHRRGCPIIIILREEN